MYSSFNNMTLRKALTQEKPSFPRESQVCGNSFSPKWPTVTDNNVVSWDAFNLHNLNASYGHILDRLIPESQLDVPKPSSVFSPVQEIAKPHDINHLIKWSDGVLGPTFEFARKILELQPGTAVKRDFMQPEQTYDRPGLSNETKTGRIKVDHTIQLDDLEMPMLVMGLGRTSRQFPGRHLVQHYREGAYRPLRQLANLCAHSNTRYGYILTDEDFVACCFSTKDPSNKDSGWTVAVKAVPWTKAGETQLTTDLALWWLCMLAVSDPRNRRLTRKEDRIEIDHWDVCLSKDGLGLVYRHHYSLLEKSINSAEGIAAASEDPFLGLNADAGVHFGPAPAFFQGANDDWANLPNFNIFPGPNQN
ncbi:hypothetical protein F4810DRAFT_658581 [Camillea tinctor]|nr:hypothetical protein F4810DRAFT_658581 [Camillea tinctor]